MIKMNSTFVLVFLNTLAVLVPALSVAGGSEVGNGDGYIIKDDGSADLADRYAAPPAATSRISGEVFELDSDPVLMGELLRIERLFEAYEIRSAHFHYRYQQNNDLAPKKSGLEIHDDIGFWYNHVFSDQVSYYFVDSLPCHDTLELKKEFSKDRVVLNFACTAGNETFIQRQAFRKLPPVLQALGLVHERLHGFYGDQQDAHQKIVPFIAVLADTLELQQKQFDGDRYPLTDAQMAKISSLMDLSRELGFQSQVAPIFRNGGGAVAFPSLIDSKSFVGVGASVYNHQSPIKNSEVLDSIVYKSSLEDSRVFFTNVFYSKLKNVDSTVLKK